MNATVACLGLLLAVAPVAAATVGTTATARAGANGRVDVVVILRPAATGGDEAAAVRHRRARLDALLSAFRAAEVAPRHRYTTLDAFSANVSAAGLAALARHPDVLRVDADAPGRGALAQSVPRIRADRVQARGITGEDVAVAVLDTGVEADHPDLRGALVDEECFCSASCPSIQFCRTDCCPNGSDRQSGAGSAVTQSAHGMNSAGIILSHGAVAAVGVAPAAKLVAIRVVDDATLGVLSDWLAALDWIAANRPDVRVVNMSLSSDQLFAGDCSANCGSEEICGINQLFADVVERLRRRGTLVFAASGNQSQRNLLGSPACVRGVVAVGAVDPEDHVAFFSNGGARLALLAPGVNVISPGLDGGLSLLCGDIGNQYVCGGTSIAAPHAAGAAALLFSAQPSASADAVEGALRSTGVPVFDARSGRTYPRVEAFAALRSLTRTLPLEPAGSSATTDCLLEWNFFPPDIVRRGPRPVAECRDGDSLCDADGRNGQCTFLLSLCFNNHEPLLRRCATDEALRSIHLRTPSAAAAPGSLERGNAEQLLAALPPLPLTRADACTTLAPFVVRRAAGSVGVAQIRMSVRTATRRDSDRFALRCLPP